MTYTGNDHDELPDSMRPCTAYHPTLGLTCLLANGHADRHVNGTASWPHDLRGMTFDDDPEDAFPWR
jgi:hypothetical protein